MVARIGHIALTNDAVGMQMQGRRATLSPWKGDRKGRPYSVPRCRSRGKDAGMAHLTARGEACPGPHI
jgi:hypothetical protein